MANRITTHAEKVAVAQANIRDIDAKIARLQKSPNSGEQVAYLRGLRPKFVDLLERHALWGNTPMTELR